MQDLNLIHDVVIAFDLWETVGMPKTDRYLRFGNLELKPGGSVSASCSACGRPFTGTTGSGDKIDEVLIRMRAEFDAHTCGEDTGGIAKDVGPARKAMRKSTDFTP